MIDLDDIIQLSERLAKARQRVTSQSTRIHQQPQELLAAFNKIGDLIIREQMVILMEIISERVELLAKQRPGVSDDTGGLVH